MHTETVMVYFDDLDAMGVVHNGKYVTLFERALAAYWTRAGWPYDPGQPLVTRPRARLHRPVPAAGGTPRAVRRRSSRAAA